MTESLPSPPGTNLSGRGDPLSQFKENPGFFQAGELDNRLDIADCLEWSVQTLVMDGVCLHCLSCLVPLQHVTRCFDKSSVIYLNVNVCCGLWINAALGPLVALEIAKNCPATTELRSLSTRVET